MVDIISGIENGVDHIRLRPMFEDRKRVFVDRLGWDVPVDDGRFEHDRFDDRHACYLIEADESGRHCGSMRLLPTVRPYILGNLFADLCDEDVPADAATYEITRLCLAPRLPARARLTIRNRLISAMVDHALGSGIRRLTGVVSEGFLAQVMAMGWQCRRLGPIRLRLGAFEIIIDADTPDRVRRTGIYSPGCLGRAEPSRAAA